MIDASASSAFIEGIKPATILEAPRLSRALGSRIVIASEAFQHTGSFKFRAAWNVARSVPQELLITASSGNFGQALACACSQLQKRCIVVMPTTSAQVKIDGVRGFGGYVELVDVRLKSREARVAELALEHPSAYIASAYDDPLVIEGNASLGRELAALDYPFDFIVAPIGGGGLSAGIVSGMCQAGSRTPVVGAEPLLGNDAARSLAAGRIVRNEGEPQTIADGARTVSLGMHNWKILEPGLHSIVEVPEHCIARGVKLLFELANLKAEPTGALSIGALLASPQLFQGACVCCIVSGGNVDPKVYSRIIAEE